ncbi:MAG TPA: PP2C family protein-serine/threonine phosphatase [Nitrolancea sp.]|nr:PP2C family protein-serine/threonine phosphatase [Nitrolancea sp.]
MTITFEVAVAKTNKFASRESGDTVEVVERPGGGISVVIVDGQGSGQAAKRLSLLVAGRAVNLLNEGVRDGTAARASHDFLFAHRGGKVSAALDIVSIDLVSRTIVLTRNSETPMLLFQNGTLSMVNDSGGRIGVYRQMRPKVLEFPAEPGTTAILLTDGVAHAGQHTSSPFDVQREAEALLVEHLPIQTLVERLLHGAMTVELNRPRDDMTVVALSVGPGVREQPVRRLFLSIPLPE